MSAPNRSALINKTFKVLKKHYKPCQPPADRSILEHLLYACVLEDAQFDAADEAFARLQQVYYDWNEVRVTSVAELAEVLATLPIPSAAAMRLKRCLQHVFEAQYSYDLEALRKQNLGKAVKELEKISGTTSFTIAYIVQHGLGGHSIPTNQGVISVLEVIGVISEAEAKKGRVPGLERAVPKSKGCEQASLLHQFGVDYLVSPNSTKLKAVILEISPAAKERLREHAPKEPTKASASKSSKKRTAKRSSQKKTSTKKKAPAKKKTPAKKKAVAKKATPAKKKTKTKAAGKTSPTKQLTKRKPR